MFSSVRALESVREDQAYSDLGQRHGFGQGGDLLDLEKEADVAAQLVERARAGGQADGATVKRVAVVVLADEREKAGAQPRAAGGVALEPALIDEDELAAQKAGECRGLNRVSMGVFRRVLVPAHD